MALFPNDSNGDSQPNLSQTQDQDFGLSPATTKAAKRQARKLFAILLSIGLILGGVLSFGVVKLLKELGLTQKPQRTVPIETPQKQQ